VKNGFWYWRFTVSIVTLPSLETGEALFSEIASRSDKFYVYIIYIGIQSMPKKFRIISNFTLGFTFATWKESISIWKSSPLKILCIKIRNIKITNLSTFCYGVFWRMHLPNVKTIISVNHRLFRQQLCQPNKCRRKIAEGIRKNGQIWPFNIRNKE